MAFDKAAWQKEYRKKNANAVTKKYEKTFKGKLMRIYRNMKSRVEGIQKEKAHLYKGKHLLAKEEFYEWALSSQDYKNMYEKWVDSGFDRRLAPTVDRINSQLGYQLNNMQWLTHSENSAKGHASRYKTASSD